MTAKAKVRIEGEDATAAAWASALGRGKKAADSMASAWKSALGGISVASLVGAGKAAIQFGDDLNKAAIKAGIGGKAMSELGYAAKMADVDLTGLSTGIKKMQVALSQAASGSKAPIEALAALGLKIKDIKGLSPDKQFELLGDRISQLQNPADRTRAAVELFGKAGADLLPLFSEGAEGLRKAREEAERLGLSFDDKTLQKLAQADDSIKRLTASWQGFAAVLTSKVAPSLSWTLDRLTGVPKDINEQLADIEDELGSPSMQRVLSMNGGARRKQLEAERARLRELSKQRSIAEMGVAVPGAPTASAAPPGFSAPDERLKAQERFVGITEDMYQDLYADIGKMRDDAIADDQSAELRNLQFYSDLEEQRRAQAEETAEFRRQKAEELSDAELVVKDAFLNAWDDMINTGKVKWDELLKYLVAEFARRGIARMFDSVFAGDGQGGWLSAVGGLFGFANGGRPPTDRPSIIGERGPEVFWPDSAGTVVPNHGLGGRSVMFAPTYNISVGSGQDVRLLDRWARENDRRMRETLDRDYYVSPST